MFACAISNGAWSVSAKLLSEATLELADPAREEGALRTARGHAGDLASGTSNRINETPDVSSMLAGSLRNTLGHLAPLELRDT